MTTSIQRTLLDDYADELREANLAEQAEREHEEWCQYDNEHDWNEIYLSEYVHTNFQTFFQRSELAKLFNPSFFEREILINQVGRDALSLAINFRAGDINLNQPSLLTDALAEFAPLLEIPYFCFDLVIKFNDTQLTSWEILSVQGNSAMNHPDNFHFKCANTLDTLCEKIKKSIERKGGDPSLLDNPKELALYYYYSHHLAILEFELDILDVVKNYSLYQSLLQNYEALKEMVDL